MQTTCRPFNTRLLLPTRLHKSCRSQRKMTPKKSYSPLLSCQPLHLVPANNLLLLTSPRRHDHSIYRGLLAPELFADVDRYDLSLVTVVHPSKERAGCDSTPKFTHANECPRQANTTTLPTGLSFQRQTSTMARGTLRLGPDSPLHRWPHHGHVSIPTSDFPNRP
jgi:hypothetical protein